MPPRQCLPNARSRDLSPAFRAELVAKAESMRDRTGGLLSELGIAPDGAGRILHFSGFLSPTVPDAAERLRILPFDSQSVARMEPGLAVVFVACSHSKPGGGWLSGARAQEESVSRESTWASQCAMFPQWHRACSGWLGIESALLLEGAEEFLGLPARKALFAGVACSNLSACPSQKLWNESKALRLVDLARPIAASLAEAGRRGAERAVLCGFGTGVFGWSRSDCLEGLLSAIVNAPSFSGEILLAAGSSEACDDFEALRAGFARAR